MIDAARLVELSASGRELDADDCAELARAVGALADRAAFAPAGEGAAVLLWRNDHSEAWLNTWWKPRDTGFHDHDGSCVGVYVVDGRVRNEALVVSGPRRVREYSAGETFSFPGTGIHRMEHERGAVTIHVYSPPIRAIGHFDVEDGELRRRPGLPDGASPPSPALTETLAR
ncbi:MAG: cysteine dioxygenase family protein [Thermoleophilia bacterium]|nr:cysteine dioxygenase family protein [Thermoleophilia bacterium]